MKTLNHKLIIKICNLCCIALTTLLIILQFVPFLYNVDGNILTRAEYNLLCDGKNVIPRLNNNLRLKNVGKEATPASKNDELTILRPKDNSDESAPETSINNKIVILELDKPIEAITTRTSIASVVWSGPFLDMQNQHVPILLFGFIGIIISVIKYRNTLNGLLHSVAAYFGLLQTVYLGIILHINIIISILIIFFALILCAYHIWKIYTWFTLEDSEYRSMWGLR